MKKLDKKRVSARLKRKRMNEEEKIRKVVAKTTIKKINLKRKEDQSEAEAENNYITPNCAI